MVAKQKHGPYVCSRVFGPPGHSGGIVIHPVATVSLQWEGFGGNSLLAMLTLNALTHKAGTGETGSAAAGVRDDARVDPVMLARCSALGNMAEPVTVGLDSPSHGTAFLSSVSSGSAPL